MSGDINADSRAAARTTLAKDIPATGGLPGHKAGAMGVLIDVGLDAKRQLVSFARPSAAGMALKNARVAATEALRLYSSIQWSDGEYFGSPVKNVVNQTEGVLFD